jgi:hypothetical protein
LIRPTSSAQLQLFDPAPVASGMIIVVDASILVAELLRKRGRELLGHPELNCVVAEEQWDEAEQEIDERLSDLVDREVFSPEQVDHLREAIRSHIENLVHRQQAH